MSAKARRTSRPEITPSGSWRSPRGKLLSTQDQILIPLSGEDLAALHRAIDAAISHLDEARILEDRVPFAERLVRLQEQGRINGLTVRRDDLNALYRALHVAAGHIDQVRGPDNQAAFIRRLAQIQRTVIDAVGDHDDVPIQERGH